MSRYFCLLVVLTLYANEYSVSADDLPAPVTVEERSRRSSKDVECYTCDNCPTTDDQTPRTYCPSLTNQSRDKKCIIYSERYSSIGNQASWVTRGCASIRGSCEEIKRFYNNTTFNQLEYCKECNGDRCNSAGQSLPGLTFAFLVVVVAPILGKCILSEN